jgi:multicomponent K+:H+ antiporter subunit A
MGIFSVAYSLRFISVFFGPLAAELPHTPHEPPHWMRVPIELLVLLCLVVGVAPGLVVGRFWRWPRCRWWAATMPDYRPGMSGTASTCRS